MSLNAVFPVMFPERHLELGRQGVDAKAAERNPEFLVERNTELHISAMHLSLEVGKRDVDAEAAAH